MRYFSDKRFENKSIEKLRKELVDYVCYISSDLDKISDTDVDYIDTVIQIAEILKDKIEKQLEY